MKRNDILQLVALLVILVAALAVYPTSASAAAACPNWGDAPTVLLSDTGCLYDGDLRQGQIPSGWYANSPWGNIGPGADFCTEALTLRPLRGNRTFVDPPHDTCSIPGQPTTAQQLNCPNWGDAATNLLPDMGCKYEGDLKLGQIPDGFYANTPFGNVGPGSLFCVEALTLRPVSGNRTFVQPPGNTCQTVGQAAPAALSASPPSCPNWGDKPTSLLPDQGCKFEGANTPGGIPNGWYANTPWGNVGAGSVFCASAITLRQGVGSDLVTPPNTCPSGPTSQAPAPGSPRCFSESKEVAALVMGDGEVFKHLFTKIAPNGWVWYDGGRTTTFGSRPGWVIDYNGGRVPRDKDVTPVQSTLTFWQVNCM